MAQIIHWLTHLDESLTKLLNELGPNAYWVIIGVIFLETAMVIFPFLPGDSLLIPVGLFCRTGHLNLWLILFVVPLAAVLGDTVNFHLGQWFGKHVFHENAKGIFKPENLASTREFFNQHGAKAIVIGRFVPIVRALAPFVAGMEGMTFKKFLPVSFLGAFIWVWVCVLLGYWFGNLPIVKEHFEHALLLLFGLMGTVMVTERLIHRANHKKRKAQQAEEARVRAVVETPDA